MNSFQSNLMEWQQKARRKLPWKQFSDPYTIWLSEILLQQTRVQQATPYFYTFKKKYPKVNDLAAATLDEVMKCWQGLGYYSRARNMHETAQFVVANLNGHFPDNFNDLLKLKGVGEYTAAAIASFAYNENCAVLDGNVFRVLSRFYNINLPIDTTFGKKHFKALAAENLIHGKADIYNQAIMDFGALVCVPKKPDCNKCVMKKDCLAFENNTVGQLPVKSKRIVKKDRYFLFLKISYRNKVYLQKRTEKDIWQGLHQFPLVEINKNQFIEENNYEAFLKLYINEATFKIKKVSIVYKQTLTHQKINARFIDVIINKTIKKERNLIAVNKKEINNFAFPKIIDCFLKDKMLFLGLK